MATAPEAKAIIPSGLSGSRSWMIRATVVVVWGAALACGVVAASAPLVRFRGADAEERQQLKWLGLPLAVTTVVYAAIALGPPGLSSAGDGAPGWTVVIVGYGTICPVAIGIAIVKYRLYSIDVAINRTVVYSVLAAFISAVYLAVAVGFGSLIGSRSNLALSRSRLQALTQSTRRCPGWLASWPRGRGRW
ncbi:MAG: hypothetical protein ACRD0H_04375, partial [Actinomycetes bacterium]